MTDVILIAQLIIVESTIKWTHEKPTPLYPPASEGRSDRCKSVQLIIGFTINKSRTYLLHEPNLYSAGFVFSVSGGVTFSINLSEFRIKLSTFDLYSMKIESLSSRLT